MNVRYLLGAIALTSLLAGPALATPTLDGTVSDHAVLQRGRPIVVTGRAEPGEAVTVSLADRSATAAADRDGNFRAVLAPMPAGGPYELLASASSGLTIVHDVLVGDVFLCSGQSNMELSVAQSQDSFQIYFSADDQLRLLTVPKALALAPEARFAKAPAWVSAGPSTVGSFSAACFYMAQELRKAAKVPIGAIHASWGGSRISPWMGEAALAEVGRGHDVELLRLYARDTAAAVRETSAIWEDWWRRQTGTRAGAEPWQPDAALEWRPVPRTGYFQLWGVPELADYLGMVWFRREVTLTADQARQPALLSLGPIDDADRTWVNGKPAGGNSMGAPRNYPLAAGTLVAGRNVITVNDDNVYANGGMLGPAEAMKLRFADGSEVPLGDGWHYAIGGRLKGAAPRVPWDDINGSGTMYNAMIAPLGPVGLAGVAWYQGESDTQIPGYADRLAAMMRDWRRQFEAPDLPFGIVELTAFGKPATAPGESGWASVRNDQRRAAEADGHAAAVVTIDIGDPLDLHPGEKHEVGRRLARAMRAMAYREPVSPSGPRISGAARTRGGVTLRFADVTGALETRSSAQAIGFELCGAQPGSCRYTVARASGNQVLVAGDGKPVARVRYAWADSPAVNLFDRAGLPVGPFEITVP